MTVKKTMLALAVLLTVAIAGHAQSRMALYQAVEKDLVETMHFKPEVARETAAIMETYRLKAKAVAAVQDDKMDENEKAAMHIKTREQEQLFEKMELGEKIRALELERYRKLSVFLTRDQIAQAVYTEFKFGVVMADSKQGRK